MEDGLDECLGFNLGVRGLLEVEKEASFSPNPSDQLGEWNRSDVQPNEVAAHRDRPWPFPVNAPQPAVVEDRQPSEAVFVSDPDASSPVSKVGLDEVDAGGKGAANPLPAVAVRMGHSDHRPLSQNHSPKPVSPDELQRALRAAPRRIPAFCALWPGVSDPDVA